MTAAAFGSCSWPSVGGKGGRLKFQVPGIMTDRLVYSLLIVNIRNRLYQLVGSLNREDLSCRRNYLTQSSSRILVLISSHSLSSWPNSSSYSIYVKLWNILTCFKFQPSTSLFRPFVFFASYSG